MIYLSTLILIVALYNSMVITIQAVSHIVTKRKASLTFVAIVTATAWGLFYLTTHIQ